MDKDVSVLRVSSQKSHKDTTISLIWWKHMSLFVSKNLIVLKELQVKVCDLFDSLTKQNRIVLKPADIFSIIVFGHPNNFILLNWLKFSCRISPQWQCFFLLPQNRLNHNLYVLCEYVLDVYCNLWGFFCLLLYITSLFVALIKFEFANPTFTLLNK